MHESFIASVFDIDRSKEFCKMGNYKERLAAFTHMLTSNLKPYNKLS